MHESTGQGQNLAQKKKISSRKRTRYFETHHAEKYGLNEAIVIALLKEIFYLENIEIETISLEKWQRRLSFWDKEQIKEVINSLIKQNILHSRPHDYNTASYFFTKEFIQQEEI